MKRKSWIITLSILAVIIVGSIVAAMIMNTPKANAPSANNTVQTTTGPLIIYYVAVDDNGKTGTKIGCGDSAVPVVTADVTTSDKVKSTFENLLANKKQFYGESGLYNVLYKSSLTFVSDSVANGTVTVKLTGTLSLAGECDNPRVQAELEMAAKTAANVSKVAIFINDKPLSEVLSLK